MSSQHETGNIKNILMFLKCTIYCFRMRVQIIVSSIHTSSGQAAVSSSNSHSGSIPSQTKTLKRTIKQAIKWLTAAFYVWIYYNLMIHLEHRTSMLLIHIDTTLSFRYIIFTCCKTKIFSTFYDTIKTEFMKSIVKNLAQVLTGLIKHSVMSQ